jgi:hypothetical protein
MNLLDPINTGFVRSLFKGIAGPRIPGILCADNEILAPMPNAQRSVRRAMNVRCIGIDVSISVLAAQMDGFRETIPEDERALIRIR